MGMCEIMHEVNHWNAKEAIRDLKEEALFQYGHDSYNGSISTIYDWKTVRPAKKFRSKETAYKFAEKRLDNVGSRSGEILDLGITHYFVAKPVVKPSLNSKSYFELSPQDFSRSSAVLVDWQNNVVDRGTVRELQERGKDRVYRDANKNVNYYIVSKNSDKVYHISFEGNQYKNTKKESDYKTRTMVFEYHNFLIYGWAQM